MRFESPLALWLLVLPVIGLFYLFGLKKKDGAGLTYSSLSLFSGLPGVTYQPIGLYITGLFRILAIILMIVALARPQKGLRSEELTTKATDILMCLDASRSMLSIDFKPDNRFEVAKKTIDEFVKGRTYDRLGMVLFAEHAITQCPLTFDKSALLNILRSIKVGSIPPDQTAIGVGLATSVNRLRNSQAKSKVIILLTDGSNNAGVVDPVTAAKTAATFGIKIYSIGVGSPDGGLMPIDDPLLGRRVVKTANDLDEDLLLKISGETDGKYFRAKSPGALRTIFQEIDKLEKTDIKTKEYVDYEELYVIFLILALILIMLEFTLNKTLFRTLP